MARRGPGIQGAQSQPRSRIPKVGVRLRGKTRRQGVLEGSGQREEVRASQEHVWAAWPGTLGREMDDQVAVSAEGLPASYPECYTVPVEPGTNSRMAYLGMRVGAGNWKHLVEMGGWAPSRKLLLRSML